ncbi:hypothetical protein [Pseudoroseomonas ludipueritiae]|uniref:Uncharacterized protein n=1 Tax=Pseudoroseomonas ludipueritiae TaxID=198093 RepID=A0ABR7R4Z3_9PROT|nr:hypothetical protein [Pseudoroseomonas ludipueritiae]MBC9176791.1 hypothetical protein [Pseudoroseomonas ludipueritiae]
MTQLSCATAQKFCEAEMSGTVEAMQRLAREIGSAEEASTTQRTIERVARAIGLSYRRAYGFFYGTAKSVSAEEWIAAQNALMASRRKRAARLRAELAALETLTGDTHAEDLAHVRQPAGLDGRPMLGRGGMVQDQS